MIVNATVLPSASSIEEVVITGFLILLVLFPGGDWPRMTDDLPEPAFLGCNAVVFIFLNKLKSVVGDCKWQNGVLKLRLCRHKLQSAIPVYKIKSVTVEDQFTLQM